MDDLAPPAGAETHRTESDLQEITSSLVENVERAIVGQSEVVEHLVTALLADGHVLLEGVPGVGKTTLAHAVAKSIDGSFKRVQFTPDLLPADVTGSSVFNQETREFEFQPGPVFANVVFGDEINRAPPKTQSALLEAMEEAQVTTDGETRPLPDPFTVIAARNTAESRSTYELPIAQLDRFLKRLRLGYPEEADEVALVERTGDPVADLEPVVTTDELLAAQERVAAVDLGEPVRQYATRLARYTREHAALGASPRATLSLLQAAQARAALDGRDYVIPDDVQSEAAPVLGHRIRADDDADVVADALASVPVP